MSEDEPTLAAAEKHSQEARQRLAATLVDIQGRLNPKALARDAVNELRQAGDELARESVAAVRRHPVTLASILTAVGLFIARRSLRALLTHAKDDETQPASGRLPPKPRTRGTKR